MNVVNSGTTYQIYGNALKTYDLLPTQVYEVNFSKMTGFFLSEHPKLEVKEEKIYGSSSKKVEKVLNGFQHTNRNFGVILSGRKGVGKSLFARCLSDAALEYNLPLLIVPEYVPGIANFISSIEQEVIVLFDEFEKTFADQDSCSPQEELLSLFDGIDSGKKLFVITCNDVQKLNSYFINRPGRFHYHFILSSPNPEEIREYMTDKLKPEYQYLIDKLIGFSMNAELTYDVLRAIAFELNEGYSFEETIMDLNISKEKSPTYEIVVKYTNGLVKTKRVEHLDFYSDRQTYLWFDYNINNSNWSMRYDFCPSDAKTLIDSGKIILDPECFSRYIDEDYFDKTDAKEKAAYDELTSLVVEKIEFVKVTNDFMIKYMV